MDIKLHRPHGVCGTTGRPFAPGETFYSALVRGESGLERVDCCAAAWAGPPAGALGWWQSAFPAPETAGPALAPVDVLLDVLEELEGRADEAALRYLLALQLVRRRVLRIVDTPPDASAAELVVACRKRDREYRLAVPPAAEVASDETARRLTALVWSGAAA